MPAEDARRVQAGQGLRRTTARTRSSLPGGVLPILARKPRLRGAAATGARSARLNPPLPGYVCSSHDHRASRPGSAPAGASRGRQSRFARRQHAGKDNNATMTDITPAAVRNFFRESERHLRRQHPGRLPQAAQAWSLRARYLVALDDAELQRIIDETSGMSDEKLLQAMAGFEAMYSDPRVRVIDTLPGGLHEAATAIACSGRVPACRHILAGAAAGSVLPAGVCILHPPLAQCTACLDEHVAAEHDPRAELTCDWCGAECLHRIFPVTLHLGPVTAVRNLEDKTSFAVGPAVIAGLGACYRCYRDVIGPMKTIADAYAKLPPLLSRPFPRGRLSLFRPPGRRNTPVLGGRKPSSGTSPDASRN